MRRFAVLLLCALSDTACTKTPENSAAIAPVSEPAPRPEVSGSPVLATASPAGTSSGVDSGAPRDPLLAPGTEPNCGAPPENPHGYEWGLTEPDASCKACPRAPAVLPRCTPPLHATDITLAALDANLQRKVRLRGVVNYAGVLCTRRGGPCACNNGCSALLRLVHRDTARPPLPSKAERRRQRDEALAKPYDPHAAEQALPNPASVLLTLSAGGSAGVASFADYATPDGALSCPGDENSICCPFALDRDSLSVRVLASGLLLAASDPNVSPEKEYRLALETLCRLPD